MYLKKVLLFFTAFSLFMSSTFSVQAEKAPVRRRSTGHYQRIVPQRGTLTQYETIQRLLKEKKYDVLRKEIAKGLDLNAKNYIGDTSVCTAIKRQDVEMFSILQTLGADISPSCVRDIPMDKRSAFIQNYQNSGGSLSYENQEKLMARPINWKMLGGIGSGVVGAGVVALAVSGGGGGGSGSGNVEVPPPTTSELEDSSDANAYLTSEFYGNSLGFQQPTDFLGLIDANKAYAYAVQNNLPVAGEGVTVGVIDSGIDTNHSDLKGAVKVDESGNPLIFEALSSGIETNAIKHFAEPLEPHGTHVAGIIAGRRNNYGMHGVAYHSDLVGAKFDLDTGVYASDFMNAFQYVVDNGAQVINNSWGSKGVYLTDDLAENIYNWNEHNWFLTPAIRYASVQNDAITVFAAGNAGDYKTGIHPQAGIEAAVLMVMPELLYYKENGTLQPFNSHPDDLSKIKGSRFVSVVAVNNEGNDLAYYSQRCGSAAHWCVAAPGGEAFLDENNQSFGGIVSTIPNNRFLMEHGTSMAAPVVSGVLANILGASPSLKPEEAVAIMFETATDLGAKGVDEVYGWGLVNLQKALQPVGTTTLALGNTTTENQINFAGSRLTLPKAFSASLLSLLPEHIVVLDKYKRGFNMSVKNIIRSTTHSKQAFADTLRSFTHHKKVQKIKPSEKFAMSFSQNENAFSSDDMSGLNFDMTYQSRDALSFSFAFSQNAKEGIDTYFDQVLRNPFTTSATELYSLSNDFKLHNNLSLGFSAAVGKNNFFDGNDKTDYQHEDALQTGTIHLAYTPSKFVDVNFSAGVLNEQNAALGLNGGGAFDMADSQTYFMGTEFSVFAIEKLKLSAAYYYGTTQTKDTNTLMNLSDIQSESIALKASYHLNNNSVFGFRANSPLYIRKASAEFNLPVARDAREDVIYRQHITADLKSEAREWDFALFTTHQADNWHFSAESMVRTSPEHQANVKNDYRLMLSFGFDY